MSANITSAYLSLSFDQLVDLVKQLPIDEKRQIIDLLHEDDAIEIPEMQQQLVMERVQKYEAHPELLIDEETALQMINKM